MKMAKVRALVLVSSGSRAISLVYGSGEAVTRLVGRWFQLGF